MAVMGKKKNLKNDIKEIVSALSFIEKYKIKVTVLVLIELFLVLVETAQPYFVGKIVDLLAYRETLYIIAQYILVFFVVLLINSLGNGIESVLLANINLNIEKDVKNKMFSNYIRRRYNFGMTQGELIERIDQDAKVIPSILLQLICGLTSDIFTVIVYLYLLMKISKTMSQILICMFPIVLAINHFYGIILRKINMIYKEEKDTFLSFIGEVSSGKKTINNFHSEDFFNKRFNVFSVAFLEIKTKALNKRVLNLFWTDFANELFYILLFFVGILRVRCGDMSSGLLVTFMTYSAVFSTSVVSISKMNVKIREAAISIIRIKEIIMMPKTRDNINGKRCVRFSKIEFDNVSFGYERVNILNNASAEFEQGKMYAIIGKSGVGKSTFLDLLAGVKEGYNGKILYDGIDVKDYAENEIAEKICYVSAEDIIFSDTIYNNIAMGKQISLGDIKDKCINAQIYDDIVKLKLGLETKIGKKNLNMSTGQNQRLLLARALCKNDVSVYLFDEMTSALDLEVEEKIINLLYELKRTSIVIIVTHKKEVAKKADVVYELQDRKMNIIYKGETI